MSGLQLLNEFMDPATRAGAAGSQYASVPPCDIAPAGDCRPLHRHRAQRESSRRHADSAAPYLDRKVRDMPHLAEVWSYINPHMLYGRHLGYKGNFEKRLAERDAKALALFHDVTRIKEEASRFMKVRAVWQFFEAERDGNNVHLFVPSGASPVHSFQFCRQPRENGLCLSDYVLDAVDGRRDHIAIFVVTAGKDIRERSEAAKNAGEYLMAHGLQSLALETAEAGAEWLHRRIREDWGFPIRLR